MLRRLLSVLLLMVCSHPSVFADGPADNMPDKVRPVPPPGITVSDADKQALTAGLKALSSKIDELVKVPGGKPVPVQRLTFLPDIMVLHDAVRDALQYEEFFNPNEINSAKSLLQLGMDRAALLLKGTPTWANDTGLVVRGYQSKIDGSFQPYGLVIPGNYQPQGTDKVRLDIWCHGRGETLSEVNFLTQRRNSVGQISPANTIVLHLYGRYCNANKLAGEIDCLEALQAVQSQYRIDEDRITIRGFSMGGAACWQFAVHYTDLFAAAAPGAGFSETPDFLKVFQKETLTPTKYEQTLWYWYDCPDWCVNLAQLPTVAYSGEFDSQKQAADIMEAALAKEGIRLTHLIGPGAKHNYHPETAAELERKMASIVARGRNRVPLQIDFATYTLRYNRMFWLTVDGLGQHWKQARVRARFQDLGGKEPAILVQPENVTDLTISFEPGWCPLSVKHPGQIIIQDQKLPIKPESDGGLKMSFHLDGSVWRAGLRHIAPGTLRKTTGLQGPIDDAFLDSFMFVMGTGKPAHDKVAKWISAESKHAQDHWRKQFRGHARIKNDVDVNDDDIANCNLVLWGDPSSNTILTKIVDKLPIKWDSKVIEMGDKSYAAENTLPLLIYPNPLNPKRYLVLNSGFTFREYDYLNNARQVPKLPDWAVIDLDTPINFRTPGKVLAADFFDENWKVAK